MASTRPTQFSDRVREHTDAVGTDGDRVTLTTQHLNTTHIQTESFMFTEHYLLRVCQVALMLPNLIWFGALHLAQRKETTMNTIPNTQAPQANNATSAVSMIAANQFEEFGTVEVTGNFRGYWRDVPRKDAEGKPMIGQDGRQIIDRSFKLSRSVKLGGQVVRQSAWVTEADAKAHGLEDGVKYRITMTVGEELMPSASNGKPDARGVIHPDEYVFADATIVSVER